MLISIITIKREEGRRIEAFRRFCSPSFLMHKYVIGNWSPFYGTYVLLCLYYNVPRLKNKPFTSKENHERVKQNHYYAVLEEEYVKRAEELLDKEGYMDCGINFTRVTYESGRREYTVLIHHRKIENLPEAEKAKLWSLLSQVEFQDEACSFRYEL